VNRPIRALVLAVSLLAAACGGSATALPQAGSPSPAASTAAASTNPSIASTAPSAASGVGAALCAFLASEIPKLEAAGSTGGAVATVAIDYANWIAADSSRVMPDAAEMDTLTEASCPEVRTNVLKFIGGARLADSF
jgi:hypothetical protein